MPFRYRPIQPTNVSSTDGDQPIDTQIEAMKQALSPKTWDLLRWMNDQDLALYEAAHEMIESRLKTGFPFTSLIASSRAVLATSGVKRPCSDARSISRQQVPQRVIVVDGHHRRGKGLWRISNHCVLAML